MGKVRLEALATPGHTPESMSIRVNNTRELAGGLAPWEQARLPVQSHEAYD